MWLMGAMPRRTASPLRRVSSSAKGYANPYTEVECWVDLEGPGFAGRVYGFWDGGRTFKVRFVATAPGEWRWRSGSNQPDDPGLNGGRGRLRAVAWSEDEKRENANRRGFVRATANGLSTSTSSAPLALRVSTTCAGVPRPS